MPLSRWCASCWVVSGCVGFGLGVVFGGVVGGRIRGLGRACTRIGIWLPARSNGGILTFRVAVAPGKKTKTQHELSKTKLGDYVCTHISIYIHMFI